MIILKTLTWSNCFSYGENNYLDLSKHRITQILGTNGVGKSSIPLILEEVLFNKNSKGIKKADIPNRLINNGYFISLDFEKNNDSYTIELNRKTSAKVKLSKNGEDISSHTATATYKTLENIIGIDFKTFSQVVYQNTNASLNFLTATDANRKKFLIDLLGLDQYTKIFEALKEASRGIDKEYSSLEGKIDTTEKWLEKNKLTDTTPKLVLKLPSVDEKDQEELSNLTADLKNISVTNRKISQNNQYKEMLKNININKVREIPYNSAQSYDKLQSDVGECNSKIKASEAAIAKFNKLGNECYACGQEVPEEFKYEHIEKEENILAEEKRKRETLQKEIKKIQEENAEFSLKQRKIKEWEDLYNNIDKALPSQLLDEHSLASRVAELKSTISKKRQELEQVERENQQISSFNARIQVILEQTKEFEEQLSDFQESFESIRVKKSNLEILKKAFSTNGLVAYKIENLVKELEAVTGDYLSELSDGRFTLNFAVTNDKLNVEITDDGKIVDILALSSGELARVNTATLLGIRKIMSSIASNKINVLFLDEVMNVLDEQGREKLVEVLLGEELNTYIVSHQWSHPLLEKIEVQKVDGISKIW